MSWDGDLISKEKPWYDEKLFSKSDFPFTIESAIYTSVTFIVIVSLIACTCLFVSYKKRKFLKENALRLSESTKALGSSLRKTLTMRS